jgi:uncharacterized damage-inducible protein DinB
MLEGSHGRWEPELDADERGMLTSFLDYQRATLVWKASGLTQEQMGRTVAASSLTIAGIVNHLALVEDSWFTEDFAGRPMPAPFTDVDWDADPDWEHRTALDEAPDVLLARYASACERSRAVVAAAASLDAPSVAFAKREGIPFTLRWILVHMIEETARHNGHVDLLREAIDGVTGE